MKSSKLVRAWRDRGFRDASKNQALAKVPHPAGIAELDEKLLGAIGGATNGSCFTATPATGGSSAAGRICAN
jgi:mersacidin/lichenicidin family type 2 lantibiotic